VGVRVDETRHDERLGTIEALLGLELLFEIGAAANCEDALAPDGDGTVFDEAVLCIHRNDVARGIEPVGWFAVERRAE
jgi:hypothetical protein